MNQVDRGITILGSSAATPAHGRNPTSQLLNFDSRYFLVDCGEGTQMQLRKYRIKFSKIDHIFISHLHGDHYFGLIGLINSFQLLGRRKTLALYGPHGLEEILSLQFQYSSTSLRFPISYYEVNPDKEEKIGEEKNLEFFSFPLKHRIPCVGYLFKEKTTEFRIIKEKLPEEIKIQEIVQLKKGLDVLDEQGDLRYAAKDHTLAPKPKQSYAYCSDTAYYPEIIPMIHKVDLLYHEATFMEDEKERAWATYHSTAMEAAKIAKEADVGRLILGHFSARYKELDGLLNEARGIFPNVFLAHEGSFFSLKDHE